MFLKGQVEPRQLLKRRALTRVLEQNPTPAMHLFAAPTIFLAAATAQARAQVDLSCTDDGNFTASFDDKITLNERFNDGSRYTGSCKFVRSRQ